MSGLAVVTAAGLDVQQPERFQLNARDLRLIVTALRSERDAWYIAAGEYQRDGCGADAERHYGYAADFAGLANKVERLQWIGEEAEACGGN